MPFRSGGFALAASIAAVFLVGCGGLPASGAGTQQSVALPLSTSGIVLKWVPDQLTLRPYGKSKITTLEHTAHQSVDFGVTCASSKVFIGFHGGHYTKGGIKYQAYAISAVGRGPYKCYVEAIINTTSQQFTATVNITVRR